jgi:acetyl esterase/lipase
MHEDRTGQAPLEPIGGLAAALAPKEARKRLRKLLGTPGQRSFVPRLRETLAGSPDAPRVERLTIEADDGAPIRGFLAGPPGEWRQLPAVLYIHAHGNRYAIGASELIEGRPALLSPPYAEALAGAGFVSLSLDLPCFGERAGESESSLAKRRLWEGGTLFGDMLAELSAALSLLGSIDGVNAERIGAFGISMGATLAFWLAALDSRVKALAQLICFADLESLIEAGNHDLHGLYMMVPGLPAAIRTGAIAGLAAPRRQFIGVGLQDPLTPEPAVRAGLADLRAAYAAMGASQALEVLLSESSGHFETPAMRVATLEFFCRTL